MTTNKGVSYFTGEYGSSDSVSFHMPGHKGADIFRRFGHEALLKDHPDRDITEIHGADNLFQPEGIIGETMEKYRKLYHSSASYLLVNGSSGGLIAAVMACVRPGEKLIMARNCHKSVFNALRLGGVVPVFAYPEIIEEYGISGAVSVEHISDLVEEHPDAKAIILPSPNYYGICSDIAVIADIAHKVGMTLIVDQAHGAHLKFFERAGATGGEALEGTCASGSVSMPPSAESSGADLVINSTHKTLCSLTQSAVLNVLRADNHVTPDPFVLEDRLQMIQSTSPSYILMESLDVNADILADHGDELIKDWAANLEMFYREASKIPGLKVMSFAGLDHTKLNLDMSLLGIDGAHLDQKLREEGIYAELHTGNILMCMTGIGNTEDDYMRLLAALKKISEGSSADLGSKHIAGGEAQQGEVTADESGAGPWTARRKWAQIPDESVLVDLSHAPGKVCAAALIPYPPGIPLLCPGEIISEEDVRYISLLRKRGEKVIGVDHKGRVAVGGPV